MYKYKSKAQIKAYKQDAFQMFLYSNELQVLLSLFFKHKHLVKKEHKQIYVQLLKKYSKPMTKTKRLIPHTLHQIYFLLQFLSHFVYIPDEDPVVRELYERLSKKYKEKDKILLESR